MPKVKVNDITMNYDQQGAGEPLILIPYLAADYACYAFQVAEYAKHFTCISVDLRGAGETDKPSGTYTTELFADDVAAFMQAVGIERAHVFGMSLGAATGMWLAAKYPAKVKTLSLHSAWTTSDPFQKDVVLGWQALERPGERDRDGYSRHLPLVLHARIVRDPARVHRGPSRFCAYPTWPTFGSIYTPVERGAQS